MISSKVSGIPRSSRGKQHIAISSSATHCDDSISDTRKPRPWTLEEDHALKEAYELHQNSTPSSGYNEGLWKQIAAKVGTRNCGTSYHLPYAISKINICAISTSVQMGR